MNEPVESSDFPSVVRTQLILECNAMLQSALSNGLELPQPVKAWLEAVDGPLGEGMRLAALAELHGALMRLVAPATPGGLALIMHDQLHHRRLHVLGPLPSIRYLLAAAIFFFILFFATGLSPNINHASMQLDILDNSGGKLIWVLAFLLSASGLGATFGALFDVYDYISDGRYDPKFDSIYWARIGLGLISGLILAELIPPAESSATAFERPLLALLGGFSAAVVHRILERLVDALEGIFVPAASPDAGSKEREIRLRIAEAQSQQRTSLATSVGQLLEHVASGGVVGDVGKGLAAILSDKPGGLSALAGKVEKVAVDAGIGLVTGGVKGAEQSVLSDVTGSGAAPSVVAAVVGALLGEPGESVLGAVAAAAGGLFEDKAPAAWASG